MIEEIGMYSTGDGLSKDELDLTAVGFEETAGCSEVLVKREELEGMERCVCMVSHLQGIGALDGKILAIGLPLGGKQPETSD